MSLTQAAVEEYRNNAVRLGIMTDDNVENAAFPFFNRLCIVNVAVVVAPPLPIWRVDRTPHPLLTQVSLSKHISSVLRKFKIRHRSPPTPPATAGASAPCPTRCAAG